MHIIPVTVPRFVKKAFPNVVWEFLAKGKSIYLTFDDGPTPEITAWTLDILKQFNAKATFFCIGKNVKEHPEIFHKIITDGHSIGNHTYNHLKGWKTKTDDYVNSILKTQKLFNQQFLNSKFANHQPSTCPEQLVLSEVEVSRRVTNLFRPPYGQIRPKQVKKLSRLGYSIIMWSVLSMDYDNSLSKEKCLKNVIENTSSGDIVVFHDSIKASKNMQYTLPKVLEYFSKKGYEFKRIPE
ncbi:Polysaccharide deacetylase [hydrothermal vent metagenome]|uniref:Polysaccharide deacetylase n=1 Tax=hydrothermal vent metagenome TaxID=652676 RepID=A0A3B0QZE2_9ZZZZ